MDLVLRFLVIAFWPVLVIFLRIGMENYAELAALLAPGRVPWIAAAGLAIAAVFYSIVWLRIGRDPQRGTVVVRYESPRGLSPAALRYVWRMAYDQRVFIAGLLSTVAKSCVQITCQERVYSVQRTVADASQLSPEEQTLADALLPDPDPLPLTIANGTRISNAVSRFKLSLAWNVERIYFRRNKGHVKTGLWICFLAVQASIMLGRGDVVETTMMGFVGLYFVTLWLSVVVFFLYVAGGLWRLGARGDPFIRSVSIAMFSLLSIFLFAAFQLLMQIGHKTSYWNTAVMMAAPLLALVFHHLLKSPTGAGRALLDEIEGYRAFLHSVEADRLKRLDTPETTPDLTDKHLAYAVALDVETKWSSEFSAVLDAAGQGAPVVLARVTTA